MTTNQGGSPAVTIGIPAYNEEEFIEDIIKTFQSSSYSNIVEIIVADGMSEDNTAGIVERLAADDKRIKLVHNTKRRQSYGLNKIIEEASGDILIRADAHAVYADNYVEESVRELLNSGAVNAGGAQRFIAQNYVQMSIALAVLSPFGSGGAKYRKKEFTGFAETVFLGSYRLDELRKLGGFSTDVGVNEDSELNIRINANYDDGVYISERIKVSYFPRGTWYSLIKQYVRYGMSRVITASNHMQHIPNRVWIPVVLMWVVLMLTIFYPIAGGCFIAGLAILLLLESIRVCYRNSGQISSEIAQNDYKTKPWLAYVPGVWLAFIGINLSFAVGFTLGVFNFANPFKQVE